MKTGAAKHDLDLTLAMIRDVEGWLSDGQARRLWHAANRVPPSGRIVEIGSFRGRSTIIFARVAAQDVEVVAIDPHAGGDRGPQEIAPDSTRGNADRRAFQANLVRAGVADRVRHVRRLSGEALDRVESPIDLLYVDGAHRYRPARSDIERWGARVRPGGTMMVHDAYNALGVMLAQLRVLVFSQSWRYVGRTRSLAEYRRVDVSGLRRASNALRQAIELPYFVRNELIKVALVARLPRVARWLGLPDSDDWPY